MHVDHRRSTNYSVVDGDLIESPYRRAHKEKVLDTNRLNASRTADRPPVPAEAPRPLVATAG